MPYIVIVPESANRGEDICLALAEVSGIRKCRWHIRQAPKGMVLNFVESKIEHQDDQQTILKTDCLLPGEYIVAAEIEHSGGNETVEQRFTVRSEAAGLAGISDALQKIASGSAAFNIRKEHKPSSEDPLWIALRQCQERRSFRAYSQFLSDVLCDLPDRGKSRISAEEYRKRQATRDDARKLLSIRQQEFYGHGVHAFQLIKAATEVFLLLHACCRMEIDASVFREDAETARLGYTVTSGDAQRRLGEYLASSVSPGALPYLGTILDRLGLQQATMDHYPFCADSARLRPCFFELIWSYWHEEGMLVQTLNAIALRFQNRQVSSAAGKPLANLALDPLRPLNNLLWGYVQDQFNQLTVRRRAYEYEHQYGLSLVGKAVGELKPADRRSKFLEAFHNLLNRCARFYQEESNRMVEPDPFPLLNAIREVHMLLAEGAHNQFGDLPSTARMEMMLQKWLLAQPPMQQFLQSRPMIPYAEPWMAQVDAMKQIMGWTDVSVTHFANLANYGEILLLSVRYGNWSDAATTADQARNWTSYFRTEIQGYLHSYRSVTGVDLGVVTSDRAVDATLPAVHLQRRLATQSNALASTSA